MPEHIVEIKVFPNEDGELVNGYKAWIWHIYGHRATVQEGSADTLPEVLEALASILGIGGIGQQEGVTIPFETAKRAEGALVYLANEYRVAAPKWDKKGMKDTAQVCRNDAEVLDKHAAVIRAALSATQPPTEEGKDNG